MECVGSLNAAGPEGIHLAILRLVKPCTQLYNALLDEGRLPADWLTSTIIPIHKGGDRSNCSSYRPVSPTAVVLKFLERAFAAGQSMA